MDQFLQNIHWAIPLLSVVAAGGGALTALNGTRERVKKVELSHEEFKVATTDRLARIETKIDILLEKK